MLIIGLTGGIGHGKTTFSVNLAMNAASHQHWESSELISEVANDLRAANEIVPSPQSIEEINAWLRPLPAILAARVHTAVTFESLSLSEQRVQEHPEHYAKLLEYCTAMQAQPALAKIPITPENKTSYRALLQWLGGYVVLVAGGVWYQELLRRVTSTPAIILATIGGVRYPSDAESIRHAGGIIIVVERPQLGQPDAGDLTERERQSILADTRIYNDGSLSQLQRCANQVYRDLTTAKLKDEYRATNF